MTNPANSPYVDARARVFAIMDTLGSEQRRALCQELSIRGSASASTTVDGKTRTVHATSDERVVNNVMRHEYRVLTEDEKQQMQAIKDKGLAFHGLVATLPGAPSREVSLAQTRIEEAVMWAVKSITK